jgi:hypothetical protein
MGRHALSMHCMRSRVSAATDIRMWPATSAGTLQVSPHALVITFSHPVNIKRIVLLEALVKSRRARRRKSCRLSDRLLRAACSCIAIWDPMAARRSRCRRHTIQYRMSSLRPGTLHMQDVWPRRPRRAILLVCSAGCHCPYCRICNCLQDK